MSSQNKAGNKFGLFCIFIIIMYLIIELVQHPIVGLIILLSSIGIYFTIYLLDKHNKTIEESRRLNMLCSHGVPGGETAFRCLQCKQIKEEAVRQAEIEKKALAQKAEFERKELLRKKEIEKNALVLQCKELERLHNALFKKQGYIQSLTPHEFENVVAEMFKNLGYSVRQTPYTNDGGKDAIAYKNNKKYLIECKHYEKNKKVGRPALQKFYAAMTEEKAEKGFFVATCAFAATAITYSKQYNIELISTDKLVLLMNSAYPGSGETDTFDVMCPECGEISRHPFKKFEDKCSNGHMIKNEFTINNISQGIRICKQRSKSMEKI